MAEQVTMNYDEIEQVATLTLPTGRKVRLSNISRERAKRFYEKHAAELARCDGRLETPFDLSRRRG